MGGGPGGGMQLSPRPPPWRMTGSAFRCWTFFFKLINGGRSRRGGAGMLRGWTLADLFCCLFLCLFSRCFLRGAFWCPGSVSVHFWSSKWCNICLNSDSFSKVPTCVWSQPAAADRVWGLPGSSQKSVKNVLEIWLDFEARF